MAMVLVMAIVLLCAFFCGVFFFLARGETDRTAVQAREIQATIIGEAVAARIGTMVDRLPWADRFYQKLRGTDPVYAFSHLRFPFDFTHGPFASGEASFRGVVKDQSQTGSYRIMVEVTYQGQKVLMTFDKAYPQGFLAVSSQDATVLAGHADPNEQDVLDQLIDRTRAAARAGRGDPIFQDINYLDQVDTALADRRSGKNPGRAILWGQP